MSKQRLDVLLVSRNLVESRELAQRLIIAGEVSVGGHPSTKPGLKVNEDADIAIRNRPRYVSRGGLKMECLPFSTLNKIHLSKLCQIFTRQSPVNCSVIKQYIFFCCFF